MSIANIAHLSSQMESLSKDQLIKLAQNPDPSIPNAQLLALTQLGKIQDTEKRMQAEQSRAQGPQPTTAQQILMQAQPQPQQMQQPQQMNMGGIVGVRGFRDGGAAAAWKASLEGRAANGYGFENRESLTPNNLQFLQGAIPRLETQVAETQGRLSDYMRQPGAREDVGSELRAQAEGTSRDLTRARQLLAQSQPENPSTNYYGTDKAYNPESAQGYDPMMGPPQPYSPRLPPDTGARGVPPGYRSGIPLEAQDVPIGGQTYGGNQQGYGGQTHGGNQFGASAQGYDPMMGPPQPYSPRLPPDTGARGVPPGYRSGIPLEAQDVPIGGQTYGGNQQGYGGQTYGGNQQGYGGQTHGGNQFGASSEGDDPMMGPPQPYSPRLPPDTRSYSERMKSGAATGYTWDKMTKALREGTTQGRKQPGYIPREGNIPAKLAEGLLGGTSRELLDPGYRNDIDDQEDFYDPRYGDASGKYTDERMEGLYIGGEDKVPSALAPSVAAGATGSKKPSAPGGLGDLDKMIKAKTALELYKENQAALGGGKHEKMAARAACGDEG
jgi:hypothetical protein